MNTILIAEDDAILRKGLEIDLRIEGYKILVAEDGNVAINIINENKIDLALLDVNIPYTDGYSLCRIIKSKMNIPVIFLTARDLEQDELQGFECGADDYVVKPFSMPLLRKRIAAVLKRNISKTNYKDNFLSIDFDSFTSSRNDEIIFFTPTEYKLLNIFTANAKQVLTRELLLEKLWDNDGNYVDEHVLTVNINRIRAKIEDADHKYIKTVYGLGYQWLGENL